MRWSVFLIFLFSASLHAQPARVWVDTDIMIGKFKHDVDDGLALLMILEDSTIQLEGISFVHGVEYAEKVTTRLLNWYASGRNIPLYRGAQDSTGLGEATAAAKAMIAALEEGPMTIVALGPMTNIATVLQLRPDLARNIERMTYCAGRKPDMHFSPGNNRFRFNDYNFELDPEATRVVLRSGVPLLLAGYDCSDELFLAKEDFIHLKKSEHEGNRWLFRKLKSWHWLWRSFIGSPKGFIPFDCATYGALFHPEEFSIQAQKAWIGSAPDDTERGKNVPQKPYLFAGAEKDAREVSYCDEVKSAFKIRLLRVLKHPDHQ